MEWTRETPTREGYYWYWEDDGIELPTLTYLADGGEGLELDWNWEAHHSPSELHGWWWGPVERPTPPKTQDKEGK